MEEHIVDTDGATFDPWMMYTQRSQVQETGATGRVGIGGDVGTGGDSICWEGPRLYLRTSTLRNCQEIQEKRSCLAFPEGVCRKARVPRS